VRYVRSGHECAGRALLSQYRSPQEAGSARAWVRSAPRGQVLGASPGILLSGRRACTQSSPLYLLRQAGHRDAISIGVGLEDPRSEKEIQFGFRASPIGAAKQATNDRDM